ncbi:transcription, DNA-dependent [Musa troglodytarum]|uniref:Transcription, DNA-dependent n=1 Tax=Musa troglodytarum TaxID=320322 RepID=A0A9E7FNQ0_9LILI|nr:transcription, DNA-dependent [Musa troglodytarum]
MEDGGVAGRSGVVSWDFWGLRNWPSPHSASSSSYSTAQPNADAAAASSSSTVAACFPCSDREMTARGNGDKRALQYHHHHHLTCLKLGKRQYYVEESGAAGAAMKRERLAAAVPRCQVDGCGKVLADEKEYHKRHKVCELHSKAPKVVVLGVEQRFCQQCSRFHVVAEFDDSKRSCRRRLAGHNERRRKNSTDLIARNPFLESAMTGDIIPCISTSPGCALSLLSSKVSPWISSSEFSSSSSAALNELIAENRAAGLARRLLADRGGWHAAVSAEQPPFRPCPHHQASTSQTPVRLDDGWSRLQEAGDRVTLDLMNAQLLLWDAAREERVNGGGRGVP